MRCASCSKCAHFVAARGGNAEGRAAGERGEVGAESLDCLSACRASYREARWCAAGTIFAHRKLAKWGFAGEKRGWIFLFLGGGGLRESGPKCAPDWWVSGENQAPQEEALGFSLSQLESSA